MEWQDDFWGVPFLGFFKRAGSGTLTEAALIPKEKPVPCSHANTFLAQPSVRASLRFFGVPKTRILVFGSFDLRAQCPVLGDDPGSGSKLCETWSTHQQQKQTFGEQRPVPLGSRFPSALVQQALPKFKERGTPFKPYDLSELVASKQT